MQSQYGANRPPRGLMAALFDFSFSEFVLTKLVKLFYGLAVVGSAMFALITLYGSLQQGGVTAILSLLVVPILFLAWVAWLRINLEVLVIVHRMAETLIQIRSELQGSSPTGAATEQTSSRGSQSRIPSTGFGGSTPPPASTSPAYAPPPSDAVAPAHANPEPAPIRAPLIPEPVAIACSSCAVPNPPDNAFCYQCGTSMTATPASDHAPAGESAPADRNAAAEPENTERPSANDDDHTTDLPWMRGKEPNPDSDQQ